MPTYKGIAQYQESNVINLFSFSGVHPVSKGTFVKIVSGFDPDAVLNMLGDVGAHFNNTVSQRYGAAPYVAACSATGDSVLGMLLYDVREVDENGEKLIFKPRKAAEMECAISGQAVPIVTKGIFFYSGIAGSITVGANAYLGTAGDLNVSGAASSTATLVGKFLGPKDSKGFALVKIDV